MAEDMEQQVDAILQPKAKVYCGGCRFYVPSLATRYVGVMTPPRCRHAHAKQVEETFEEVTVVSIPPERRNGQNDCADWQPKTFYSDLRHNAFKRMMLYLAGLVLFMLAWGWRNVLP